MPTETTAILGKLTRGRLATGPPRVYLAGRYEDQARLRQVALDWEREHGVKVISSWLWNPTTHEATVAAGQEAECAKIDLDEINACDVLVLDTEGTNERGGREFEAGYALGLGKLVFHVGPDRSIFHKLLMPLEATVGQDA